MFNLTYNYIQSMILISRCHKMSRPSKA